MNGAKPKREMLRFTGPDGKAVMMLPAKPGNCEICNTKHPPHYPHDQTNVFYQMRFYYERGENRFPSWADAMEHCDDETRKQWTRALIAEGVDPKAIAKPSQATVTVRPDNSVDVSIQDPSDAGGVVDE